MPQFAQLHRLQSVRRLRSHADGDQAINWLVSVCSLDEARIAERYHPDLLDLKDPSVGALAPVSVETWNDLSDWARKYNSTEAASSRPIQLSAALGESAEATQRASQLPAAFHYAKAGPSGCDVEKLTRLWTELRIRLPRRVELVAVAYADHVAAQTLSVESILRHAAKLGFRRLLVDTFDKTTGASAIDQLGSARIAAIGNLARQHRLWWALAGSLTLEQTNQLRNRLGSSRDLPNCVALRGDVCTAGRNTAICPQRLKQWQLAIHDWKRAAQQSD